MNKKRLDWKRKVWKFIWMKKIILLLVLGLIFVTSCSEKRVIDNVEKSNISELICECPEVDAPVCEQPNILIPKTYVVEECNLTCYKPICEINETLIFEKVNITKIKIDKKITNDTKFCNYRKEDDYSNCTCQEGYLKVDLQASLHLNCIPEICTLLTGYTFDGHLGFTNSGICATALFRSDVSICRDISTAVGRDICFFAYVSKTNNVTICENIKNSNLKNECYK